MNKRFSTERLVLVPVNFNIVASLLKGESKVIDELGYKMNSEWPRKDTFDILEILSETMGETEEPSGYGLWMIIRKEDMLIVGDAGFMDEPNESGETEIGYGIIDSERKKGYGYETTKGLLNWAFSQENVKVIKARCFLDNIPSIRILEKIGMVEEKRDDELIYWNLNKDDQ